MGLGVVEVARSKLGRPHEVRMLIAVVVLQMLQREWAAFKNEVNRYGWRIRIDGQGQ